MTEACLRAIKYNTAIPYRIILIDNGSTSDYQLKYLQNTDIYVKMDRNYGLEHVKHLGMSFVESDLFVSMDNDILVYRYDTDWLTRLIDLMNRYPAYGAIACRPQVLVADTMRHFETEDEVVEFPRIPGYARIMRTKWVNEVGAWWDKREGRGHEEIWISEKFREHGFKVGWANKVKCWHLFGEEDTDGWGYPKGMKPEDHGHNPVWPMPKNDRQIILNEVGIEVYGI